MSPATNSDAAPPEVQAEFETELDGYLASWADGVRAAVREFEAAGDEEGTVQNRGADSALPAPRSALEDSALEDAVLTAQASDRAFVAQRLLALTQIADPELRAQKLAGFRASLPGLARDLTADPAAADAYERLLGEGLAAGLQRSGRAPAVNPPNA